jgi:DNA-binding NarL/FixJ family response regulator
VHLVGRDRPVALVRHLLRDDDGVSVVVVGPGGSGRSTVLDVCRRSMPARLRQRIAVVDDLHDHDGITELSAEVRSGRRRVLGALDVRAVDRPEVAGLLRLDAVVVVELSALRRVDVVELAARHFGGALDDRSIDRLLALSGGLPKMIELLAAVARAHNRLDVRPGGLLALAPGMPVDARLDTWFARSTDGVDPELVGDLAVVGTMPLPDARIDASVEQAIRAGVVVVDQSPPRPAIRLASPMVAEVWCSRRSDDEITRRRSRWLDDWWRTGANARASIVQPEVRRVVALVAAARGPHDDVDRDALAEEVARCLARGDPIALTLTDARLRHERTASAALDASLALEHAGRPAETLELAREAEDLATDDLTRAVAVDRQASALVRLGRGDDAVANLIRGLGTVQDAGAVARLQVALVNRMLHAGRLDEVAELVAPFLDHDPVPREAALIGAIAAIARGRARTGEHLGRIGARASDTGADVGFLVGPLLDVARAVAALELGRPNDASTLVGAIRESAVQSGNRPLQGWAGVVTGWIELARGATVVAIAAFREAIAGFTGTGEPVYLAWSTAGLAAALGLAGRHDDAAAVRHDYARLGVRPEALFAPEAERAMALAEALGGDASAAAIRLDAAIAAAVASSQWSQALGCALDRALLTASTRTLDARTASRTGDGVAKRGVGTTDLPAAVVDALSQAAPELEGDLTLARLAAWRLLTVDEPSRTTGEEAAEESMPGSADAAEWWDVIDRLAQCGALVTAARLARVAHDRADTPRARRRAARRLLALVAVTNASALTVDDLELPRLGPRARHVAEMAATGLGRRDIAEQLYLSRRTVDRHLSEAFTRLGVDEVGELGGALADLAAFTPVTAPKTGTVAATFRGREREVETISGLWARGAPGVVIEGPPGSGRSRLAVECGRRLALSGWSVTTVRGTSGVAACLDALAELGPGRVALVVDDLHLLDAGARDAIRVALQIEDAFLVATVVAGLARPLGEPTSHPMGGELDPSTVTLGPLDDETILALAADQLGGPIATGSRGTLLRFVAGNPLLLREGLRTWLARGGLAWTSSGWALDEAVPSLPMRALVRSHLALLSPAARHVLRYLAVGDAVPEWLLAVLVGRDAVTEVRLAGLVTPLGDDLVLAHEVHRAVAEAEIDFAERRRLLGELCACVADARRSERVGVGAARRAAWSLAAGGAVDVELLVEGARAARDRLDLALAERLAVAAVQRGGGAAVELLLADLSLAAGRRDEADARLQAIASGPGPIDARVQAALARSDQALWVDGDADAADRALAVPDVGRLPRSPHAARFSDQRRLIDLVGRGRVVPTIDKGGAPDGLAGAGVLLATGRPLAAATRCAEAIATLDDLDGGRLPAENLRSLQVECWMEAGELERALAALRTWIGEGSWSSRVGLGLPAGAAARVLLRRGQVTRGAELVREALRAPAVTVGSQSWFWLRSCLAFAAASSGDAAEARAELAATAGIAELGVSVALWRSRAGFWATVGEGKVHDAVAGVLEEAERLGARGLVTSAAQLLHDALRVAGTAAVAESLEAVSAGMEGDLAVARRAHARAVCDDDPAAAVEAARRLAAAGADLAAAELAAGAVPRLRRRGSPAAARAALQQARTWRESCVGAATPELLMPTVTLTPRQLEVARRAAAGERSRAIADQLGVSVRTVENLLQRAYERLGVSGRDELAVALGRRDRVASPAAFAVQPV